MRKTFLLPKRVTARPLKGIVRNWPIGRPSKILPSAASFRCSADFISGMRLAQLAKHTPWQKKKADTAIRTWSLVYGVVKVAVVVKLCNNDTKIIEKQWYQN